MISTDNILEPFLHCRPPLCLHRISSGIMTPRNKTREARWLRKRRKQGSSDTQDFLYKQISVSALTWSTFHSGRTDSECKNNMGGILSMQHGPNANQAATGEQLEFEIISGVMVINLPVKHLVYLSAYNSGYGQ